MTKKTKKKRRKKVGLDGLSGETRRLLRGASVNSRGKLYLPGTLDEQLADMYPW